MTGSGIPAHPIPSRPASRAGEHSAGQGAFITGKLHRGQRGRQRDRGFLLSQFFSSPRRSLAKSVASFRASCRQPTFLPVACAEMSFPPPLPSIKPDTSCTHWLAFRPLFAVSWAGKETQRSGQVAIALPCAYHHIKS